MYIKTDSIKLSDLYKFYLIIGAAMPYQAGLSQNWQQIGASKEGILSYIACLYFTVLKCHC